MLQYTSSWHSKRIVREVAYRSLFLARRVHIKSQLLSSVCGRPWQGREAPLKIVLQFGMPRCLFWSSHCGSICGRLEVGIP